MLALNETFHHHASFYTMKGYTDFKVSWISRIGQSQAPHQRVKTADHWIMLYIEEVNWENLMLKELLAADLPSPDATWQYESTTIVRELHRYVVSNVNSLVCNDIPSVFVTSSSTVLDIVHYPTTLNRSGLSWQSSTIKIIDIHFFLSHRTSPIHHQ